MSPSGVTRFRCNLENNYISGLRSASHFIYSRQPPMDNSATYPTMLVFAGRPLR
jgi:hypothetical protein